MRAVFLLALVAVALSLAEVARAQSDDLDALNRHVVKLYQAGQYVKANELAHRALRLAEQRFGRNDPRILEPLNNLAETNKVLGKYKAAEPLAKQSLALRERTLGPNHPRTATALNNLADLNHKLHKYREAELLYRRALSVLRRTLGPKHPNLATALNNLAGLLDDQSRFIEAERLYKRSLSIRQSSLGDNHAAVGQSLHNLASSYRDQGRYREARPLYDRSLEILSKALGPNHPLIATVINNIAKMHREIGDFNQAIDLHKRALKIQTASLGRDHQAVGATYNNLAAVYYAQGLYAKAQNQFRRALKITTMKLGPRHPSVGATLGNLALVYERQGRYLQAEALFKRALSIREQALGSEHPTVGTLLSNLGNLYRDQHRYVEARRLYFRALEIREKARGSSHPDVSETLNNIGEMYRMQRMFAKAEPFYKRSLDIDIKTFGPDHNRVGTAYNNLGLLYNDQGNFKSAEPLLKRALDIATKTFGPDHPRVAFTLNNIALSYSGQGRYAEALQLFERNLRIERNAFGPDHPSLAITLNNIGDLHFSQGHWESATSNLRRGVSLLVRRDRRTKEGAGVYLADKANSETSRSSFYFSQLVKAAHRLVSDDRAAETSLRHEMFAIAQWGSHSDTAAAISRMSARQTKGDLALATLVRKRQDLVREWQKRDQLRIAAVSQPPGKRNRKAEAANVGRLTVIDARISEIDKRLANEFPDYTALTNPQPLSVKEVQLQLTADEALVLILDTPAVRPTSEETFIWAVTKTDSRWVRSPLGTKALTREVAALRCGLDRDGEWKWAGGKQAWLARKPLCAKLWPGGLKRNQPLPFDVARAHRLYKGLFGGIGDLIKGKRLLIVPSGALTALPLQVLVTAPPAKTIPSDAAGYAKVQWLGQRNALTVLPTVASLKALRAYAKSSKAAEPFIGFGNPLLTGRFGNDKRAWDKQRCPPPGFASRAHKAIKTLSQQIAALFSRGLADVDKLRNQPPLPETADELCAVARAVGVDPPDPVVHLGARATEASVKRLSTAGTLARARIVHMATHGLVAGETARLAKTRAEPALMLTPPAKATEVDDGLLTASEVTTLKLDADWVILSACNTAAGDTVGGDTLSGLARAFFYAGARALLVSHWYVDSEATVALITNAFKTLKAEPEIGRAEAMRRAMAGLIAAGGRNAHPANWAPFVVVGEGGAGR